MNKKRGFRRMAFILSIISACVCAITGITAAERWQEKWSQSRHEFCRALTDVLREFHEPHPWPWPPSLGEGNDDFHGYYGYVEKLSWQISSNLMTKQLRLNAIDSNGMPYITQEERKEIEHFIEKYGGSVYKKAAAVQTAWEPPWTYALIRNPTRTRALIGLGYAIAGFCGVWLCYFIAWLVYKLVMWVWFGFRTDTD